MLLKELADAIKERSWVGVADIYFKLTGESIDIEDEESDDMVATITNQVLAALKSKRTPIRKVVKKK